MLQINCLYFTNHSTPKEITISNNFNSEQKKIIIKCINKWNNYSQTLLGYDLIIYNNQIDNYEYDDSTANIDNKSVIYFIDSNNSYYLKRDNALGRANTNDIMIFSDAIGKYFELTIMHEFGHWLGIYSHIDDSPNIIETNDNVMNATAGDKIDINLSNEDIKLFCMVHKCLIN